MKPITLPLPNFIMACIVMFTMGFFLPITLKQLGINII
ncbi:hypothetical protein LCGC14_2552040 [marine sediment metagenome]|uniref:Uncharacterized protein n=1 Tax=marine sediment metagenome TaxID=412755 RepID=A0A0F9DFN2_9ZZZZ